MAEARVDKRERERAFVKAFNESEECLFISEKKKIWT